METLWQDLKYGVRQLARSPGFTAVAVLTLALGIGANTALFSVIRAVLLAPLPFKEPDRLVMLWEYRPDFEYLLLESGHPLRRNIVNPGNFLSWRERNRVFDSISAYLAGDVTVTGQGEPEEISVGQVTSEFFDTLGVSAQVGRTFLPEEGVPGAADVVILSHGYWQRHFGADPAVLDKTLTLNGSPVTIVGVMPPDFDFPPRSALWVPLTLSEGMRSSRGHWMAVLARLKEGVTLEQAQAEMAGIWRQLQEERPEVNANRGLHVFPLHYDLVTHVRGSLLVLMGAVGFVLLIACANVALLLLIRASKRESEFSIRAALGANRFRLVRQVLTESVLLALLGGVAGVLVAYNFLHTLLAIIPSEIPFFLPIAVDRQVLGFTLLVCLITGVLFGLVPALQTSRPDLHNTLKEGGRTSASGIERHHLRKALVVGEVAVALVLLAGAGLLLRSFLLLSSVDPGYDASGLLTMKLTLPPSTYHSANDCTRFYRDVLTRIEGLPGVKTAGALSWLPLGGRGPGTAFVMKDRPAPPAGQEPLAFVWALEGNIFRTLRIPLIRGRFFTEQDSADAPGVVLINQSLARQYWPGDDPVGKRIAMNWGKWMEAEIVGVVGNARLRNLDTAPEAALYWPQAQLPYRSMSFMIRIEGSPLSLVPAVKAQVQSLDPNLPLTEVQPLAAVVANEFKQPRFRLLLVGLFAALALGLALLGLYGVISYAVSQRTHEIGIRMALGARRGEILTLVVGQGLALTLIGLGIGLAASFGLTRFLATLLYGVGPYDPATLVGVSLLLLSLALGACWLPARRATRVDPLVALRYE